MTGNKQASDVSGGANATEGKIPRGRGGGVGSICATLRGSARTSSTEIPRQNALQ